MNRTALATRPLRLLAALCALALCGGSVATAGAVEFPRETWAHRAPEELGLDGAKLDAVAAALGSRGCIVKDGYVVKAWGSQSERDDWASSAKPVLSALLMFAVEEGKVKGFDQPIAGFGRPYSARDRPMTFCRLANMMSGYARPEPPGAAWAEGAGRPLAISLGEFTLDRGQRASRIPVDDAEGHRREKIWPAYRSEGGAKRALAPPPSAPDQDWVVLIRHVDRDVPAPISTAGFKDGAHHWRRIRDDSRIIQAEPDQPAYAPSQVREIAANLLRFQRENGGWPKDYDMLAVLTDGQHAALRETRGRDDTSFDNHNVHSQVDYLARAYAAHGGGDDDWRAACLRGLDFMLAAQLPNGGFPQRYPRPTGYAAHVTFNDGVMIGILNVLKDAADGAPHWKWLDAGRRERARRAVAAGTECVLKCQIRVDGRATGWCQQHDAATYEAAPARTFELASTCPQETTEIVEFLMREPDPGPEVRSAIDSAVAWLRRVRLSGVRVDRVPAPVTEFLRHRADFDVVVVDDPKAPAVWARHYEIGTDRPVFAGRDGVKRYRLADIERERRTGTPWYGRWPRRLLDTAYEAWRRRLPPQ